MARRASALAAFLILAAGVSGCNKLKARDLLNKGVAAYKNGQYDVAIDDFQKSKELDPSLMNARLYLATAYASQYIPGAPSEQNMRLGNAAINEFKEVLQIDPNNISAIDGIGSILYQMAGTPYDIAKFEESKNYHKKHIELKPTDPEPYYWIGVIDWVIAQRVNLEKQVVGVECRLTQLQIARPNFVGPRERPEQRPQNAKEYRETFHRMTSDVAGLDGISTTIW